MDVHEILTKAWSEVEKANLPDELREVAFREAVRLVDLTGDGRQNVSVPLRNDNEARTLSKLVSKPKPAPRRKPTVASNEDSLPEISEDELFEKVERETGVSRGKLEKILHLDGKKPCINLPARLLGGTHVGDNTKARMLVIAQVITVVRHYGMDEAETSINVIRVEASRLKVLDAKNFSRDLGALEGILVTGPRNGKVLRVRSGAVKKFSTIVDELVSGEEA